jgi:hypothetical protein
LIALLTSSGCAARGARPEHPATGQRETEASVASVDARSPSTAPARREMTWDEYYTEIANRARKHGVMVIWVHPPEPAHAAATPPRSSADDALR